MIGKIIETQTGNDFVSMTAKGFEEISTQRKYCGISTQIIGQMKNVRVHFNVDIGVGDIIAPKAEERRIGLSNRNGTDEQRGDTEWVKFLNWNRGNRRVLGHIIVLSIKFIEELVQSAWKICNDQNQN